VKFFSAKSLLELLSLHQSSILVIQPWQITQMLPLLSEPLDLPHLKTILVSSTPEDMASQSLLKQLSNAIPKVNIFVTLGTNETSGVIAVSKQNQFADNFIGQPLLHSEVQVLGINAKPVKKEEIGTLFVKGFNVMHSIKNNLQQTQNKIKNGWLNTGLKAQMQTDGLVIFPH